MSKEILHIWGPFSIQSYGLFVAIGIALAIWLFLKNPKRKHIITHDNFSKVIVLTVCSAIIGGRILYLIEDCSSIASFWDFFKIWEGGLSSLGSIIAVLLVLPLYLRRLRVPLVPFLDLAAIYAPLIESVARIGCFLAGCCYGKETIVAWAVTYTNHDCLAPLYKPLHPTQIYSSIAALAIFALMKWVCSKKLVESGQLILSYLMLTSIARFSIDFLRADQTFFATTGLFSILSTSQWISLLLCAISCTTIVVIQVFSKE